MQAIIEPTTGPPAADAPAWLGWYRRSRREPWRQLVGADTHDACWEALLNELAKQGARGGDSCVVREGENPNQGASARRPATAGR